MSEYVRIYGEVRGGREKHRQKYITMYPNKCMTAFQLFSMGKSSFTNNPKYLLRAYCAKRV